MRRRPSTRRSPAPRRGGRRRRALRPARGRSCRSTRRTRGRAEHLRSAAGTTSGAALGEQRGRARPHRRPAPRRVPRARAARRGRRERAGAGTPWLYNTMLTLGPAGLLARHRKLMPTQHERLFHGVGAGDDLTVAETPVGRIGGLICWENRCRSPAGASTRAVRSSGSRQRADDSDGWLASMRHIAIESGAYVVSVPQYIPASAFPDDFPVPLPEGREVCAAARPCANRPRARSSPGRCTTGKGSPSRIATSAAPFHAKRWFDVVGHYGRADVLTLTAQVPAAGAATGATAVRAGRSARARRPGTRAGRRRTRPGSAA